MKKLLLLLPLLALTACSGNTKTITYCWRNNCSGCIGITDTDDLASKIKAENKQGWYVIKNERVDVPGDYHCHYVITYTK